LLPYTAYLPRGARLDAVRGCTKDLTGLKELTERPAHVREGLERFPIRLIIS
jgi:hypothetical protein